MDMDELRRTDIDEFDFQQANTLVDQRQRFQRRAKKASTLINYLLARKGYAQTQSTDDLQSAWFAAAGDKWKSKTRVGNLSRGVLEIHVKNSAAIQQLTFLKKKLLRSLGERLPQNKIKDIKFRVGNID